MSPLTWGQRIATSDQTAEKMQANVAKAIDNNATSEEVGAWALVAIAAELRAARIAQRPAVAGRKEG